MNNEHENSHENSCSQVPRLMPFTVSGVYDDGLEATIVHCMATDAQAARDEVVMKTKGAVVIASVFAGHLTEPDAVFFDAGGELQRGEEADGNTQATSASDER